MNLSNLTPAPGSVKTRKRIGRGSGSGLGGRFYAHRGIDLRSVIRAALVNLRYGGIREGASTITQQLIKNLFLSSQRTFWRKCREVWITLVMEAVYSQDEILEL